MTVVALILIAAPAACFGYAYIIYPLLLRMLAPARAPARSATQQGEWPSITLTVPCYNEEASIAATLDHLLAADYPAERRQILVISDASTDTARSPRSFARSALAKSRLSSSGKAVS